MDLGLEGKRVLVTGGSKGLGLACARSFLAEGASVAIVSRSNENLARAREVLGPVIVCSANLADAAQAARMVEEVERDLGPVDVLVNSAGAAQRTPFDELDVTAWRAAMDAKYFSYVNVIDPLIRRMGQRGRGVIISIAGTGGKIPLTVHIPGGAANAALMLATAGLAAAYGRKGVRVLSVNPAGVATERLKGRLEADAQQAGVSAEEALRRMADAFPPGRLAEPREIADVVVFLASERASYVSGANLGIDGAAFPCVV